MLELVDIRTIAEHPVDVLQPSWSRSPLHAQFYTPPQIKLLNIHWLSNRYVSLSMNIRENNFAGN